MVERKDLRRKKDASYNIDQIGEELRTFLTEQARELPAEERGFVIPTEPYFGHILSVAFAASIGLSRMPSAEDTPDMRRNYLERITTGLVHTLLRETTESSTKIPSRDEVLFAFSKRQSALSILKEVMDWLQAHNSAETAPVTLYGQHSGDQQAEAAFTQEDFKKALKDILAQAKQQFFERAAAEEFILAGKTTVLPHFFGETSDEMLLPAAGAWEKIIAEKAGLPVSVNETQFAAGRRFLEFYSSAPLFAAIGLSPTESSKLAEKISTQLTSADAFPVARVVKSFESHRPTSDTESLAEKLRGLLREGYIPAPFIDLLTYGSLHWNAGKDLHSEVMSYGAMFLTRKETIPPPAYDPGSKPDILAEKYLAVPALRGGTLPLGEYDAPYIKTELAYYRIPKSLRPLTAVDTLCIKVND